MSLKVLVEDRPSRSLAIVADRHALVFKHSLATESSGTKYDGAQHSRCTVGFAASDSISQHRVLRGGGIFGTLGLILVGNDIFICLINASVRVASVRPNENVQRILSVEFICLNNADYDSIMYPDTESAYRENAHQQIPSASQFEDGAIEHPCLELKRMLSSGTFYYSVDLDLTNRLQDRRDGGSVFDLEGLDTGYLWNSFLIDPLIKFRTRLSEAEKAGLDASRILTLAIRGFVATIRIPPNIGPAISKKTNLPSYLSLISRLACRRAGTRFNSRGIDDDGNVANFVETETVFWHPSGNCFSYVQIRGSVPIFWEQATGILPGQQKIQIARSAEATQPAFDKHFESLELHYGAVHILNLLSVAKTGEAELINRYSYHVQQSSSNQIVNFGNSTEKTLLESQFDFHAETKGGGYDAANMIRELIRPQSESFGFFLSENPPSSRPNDTETKSTIVLQQEGAFRTNCLDCLDRTNLVQTILSRLSLEAFLGLRQNTVSSEFWTNHSALWADNGDALSKIYAGTGALKSSFTRHGKMSLAGAIADARKSATRLYMNNFVDKSRQNTIDMLLGRLIGQAQVQVYDPITDFVNAELKKCAHMYTRSESIRIWVGTFNLNGKGDGPDRDLSPWLCPKEDRNETRPEIVVVAFQEMVELSPQQVMSTDPIRRQSWESAVIKTINSGIPAASDAEYVLLRSGQLVGAALMVFVKSQVLSRIKNVEGSEKKTGLSGMAGNKGAVAIRMDFANTRLCFVTAHLAAGFANYEERNRDYRTISHGLRFQKNRSIEDHDAIIWAGDFNYRIGLSDERVRDLAGSWDLETLYQNDQLNLQMVAGRTFAFYSEARITFLPTYKYNNGTDTYDNSEKSRIPAWCDRILRRGDIIRQLSYATAPLRFSDHRPVCATFQCTINIVDEAKREGMVQNLYDRRKIDLIDNATTLFTEDLDDDENAEYDAISPELPPASSDRHKWWLEAGHPARSTLSLPSPLHMPNLQRPSNPFSMTDQADWVSDEE